MATPAYTPLDSDKPDGVTQTPAQYSASDLANVRALRDALVSFFVPGWTFAIDTTAFPIEKWTWSSGVLRLRLTITKVDKGAGVYQPSKLRWDWSNDSGVSYQPMSTGGLDANVTMNQFGGVTAIDRDAGMIALVLNALGAGTYAGTILTGHTAGVGAAVHGLGTMSIQNAAAVNITGGTVANVNVNGAAINNSALNGAFRVYPNAPPTLASGAAWNWAVGPTHYRMAPGGVIPNITNPQQGEVKRIYVFGAGIITVGSGGGVNFIWGTGHPTWGVNATLVTFCAYEASAILGTTIPF